MLLASYLVKIKTSHFLISLEKYFILSLIDRIQEEEEKLQKV